eukprot:TRINITY_DN6465_c0_g1_i2.p1 TRINITY_DN6465_c0_g1~~TRINITY_DN6465_c0_g1_i2.p1  ORF type:complete len:521 (+),score=122.13 TRINITY_DN6465_c0_g1_i2:112-1674(+)
MADPTKKCSKDELFDAMVKYKKKAQDAEAQRRAQQQGSEEVEMRVESLALQVSLYKEKEREIQADCDRERQEKEMAQVVAESLRTEHASLAAKLTQAEATVATLQRENATMSQALTQAPTDTEDIALERIDSGADANQLAASLREARALASEYKARIEDLQRSHEAFVEQSRLETEAEADRKVRAAEEALRGSRTTWEEERAVIVKAHMQKMDELQAMYNELKAGVETSQAWQFKEREVVALKDELAALRCEYNAACDRTLEVRKHQAEVGKRDELVAQLRDQVMVLETDLADTRDLCIRALRQTATAAPAADPHAVIQHPNDTVSVASSGSLSGSLTPPTSPREKPDLFDLLHSKSRTKTLHKDAKKELTKYKTKVLAQEQARQRNVDQVESYRADQLHALLTENEALRRAVDKTESCETSEEMLRVRQLHHRERDAWDEERTELHEQLKQSQASTAVQALTAEIKQIQAKLQKAEARCAALVWPVALARRARSWRPTGGDASPLATRRTYRSYHRRAT